MSDKVFVVFCRNLWTEGNALVEMVTKSLEKAEEYCMNNKQKYPKYDFWFEEHYLE